jgi:hypothetical protein
MKLFTVLVLALAACGSSSKKSNTTTGAASGTPSDDTAMVDPTLPSWAPKSCNAYHVVVVKAVDCPELDQARRDSIKNTYETQNTAWHQLQNADQSAIDQIGVDCTEGSQAVEAQAAGKCLAAASM